MLNVQRLQSKGPCIIQRYLPKGTCRQYIRSVSTTLLDRRIETWNKEKERQSNSLDSVNSNSQRKSIQLSVLGSSREAVAGLTTPLDLARKYDQNNARKYIVAKINGNNIWDMQRPIPESATSLEFLRFDTNDPVSKEVFWHSSAHVMGAALESLYGDDLLLCDGPALQEGGFFYEFLLLNSNNMHINRLDREMDFTKRIEQMCGESIDNLRFLATTDLDAVKSASMRLAKQKHFFERMEVSYDVANELFLDNPFKLHFLNRVRKNEHAACGTASQGKVSLYKCGNMIDLCRGPHVVHTSQLQAFGISRVSSAHWVGHLNTDKHDHSKQKSPVLNRVYGISFSTQDQLKEYTKMREEAAKRDHRIVGKDQKLFMMHPWAPGSAFLMPHGQRMVNKIMSTIRRKYTEYGFDEVSTPLMYNRKVWETSGHWENYRDDMFVVSGDITKGNSQDGCCGNHSHGTSSGSNEPEFGLKPMNCPGHCLMFANDQRSYKDLPIRYADFSPLHRNEVAGALSGLTRVRKFHQDDGHIFCTRDQVPGEIENCLRFIDDMYKIFGFPSYEFALSTRPEKYIGNIDDWNEAENALKSILNKTGKPWVLNDKDGAFYGPKIDVRVQDALDRKHQTATIQLDFQLPQRFQLKYTGPNGQYERPVMIHRAVLGSMERMLAVLIEHWGGKWPFWVNPRQAIVIPTSTAESAHEIVEYAGKVRDILAGSKQSESVESLHFFIDLDNSGNTLNRAVRQAQLAQYSYILVVGEKEVEKGTVDVRQRQGGRRIGNMAIEDVRQMFENLANTYQ